MDNNIDEIIKEVLDYAIPYVSGMARNKETPTIKKPLTAVNVDPDSGVEPRDKDTDLAEADSPTTRTRRFNRKNRKKVRAYLRKTQDDRVARNRDRRKAVKKHGKKKMANHDVHHPNGPQNGGARLAKKDHGPDKKNESIDVNAIFDFLYEGGAAGHMAHPYEDDSLTFGQVKDMIHRGLVGALDTEAPMTEKLDGQNIAFTIRDGQILFARNKGQVKNRAKNALDVSGIKQKFAGRGNIEKAFTGAAVDLEAAIGKMPPEQRDAIFGNGSKFMNVEVIFPDTKNVIPYDKAVLVFHGTIEYDEEGNEVGRSQDDAKAVATALTKANADKQKVFGISGPKTISFSDTDISKNRQKLREYIRKVQRLENDYKLTDKDTIEDYKRVWWDRELSNMGLKLSKQEKKGLIDRWAMGLKSFSLNSIQDENTKKIVKDFEKNQLPSMQRRVAQPLERLFLQVGTDSMKRVVDFLAANNPQAASSLKKEVLDTIRELEKTDDQNKLAKLQIQIERLNNLGVDNIVPSEGIVFVYNGKPYKFTGTFAPVNQILGTLKFDAGKAEIVKPAEKPEKATQRKTTPAADPKVAEVGPPKTIAVFSGRFQPFHTGHYSIYKKMVDKFGVDNVYIGTSDVVDPVKSPFNFKDKQQIISKMFNVPEDKIVQVENPYAPTEILQDMPPNTIYVTAVSQKDAERLKRQGKYFEPYDDKKEKVGYPEKGYYFVSPEFKLTIDGKNVSGTQLRAVMGNPRNTERAKKEIFTKVYGKFNPEIFKKIVRTTTEAEEARELTTKYGNIGLSSKEKTKKMLGDKTARQSIKHILKQRILNPKTKRKIYVATALTYDKKEPVRKSAEELIRKTIETTKKVKKKRS